MVRTGLAGSLVIRSNAPLCVLERWGALKVTVISAVAPGAISIMLLVTLKRELLLSIALMISGLFASMNLVTEPIAFGVNRYAQAAETPSWVNGMIQALNIVPDFFIIGIGIYLLLKKKNPHMFLAGFLMLAFTMLGIFLGKDPSGDKKLSLMFYISMYGEAAIDLGGKDASQGESFPPI